MKLEQSFEVTAPIDRVWQALVDVEQVAPCLPGAAVTGRNSDGSYAGTFTVKIGPTSASYSGRLKMEEIDEESHTATMNAQGNDRRGQGGAKATIVSKLTPTASGTKVDVNTDYHITGRLARFGRGGMIADISERLLREFASRLQASLMAAPAEAPVSVPPPEPERPVSVPPPEPSREPEPVAEGVSSAEGVSEPVEAETVEAAAETVEAEPVGVSEAEAVSEAPVEAEPVEAETVEAEAVEAEIPVEAEPVEAEAVEAEAVEAEAVEVSTPEPVESPEPVAPQPEPELVGVGSPAPGAGVGAPSPGSEAAEARAPLPAAPMQPAEPLEAGALMRSMLWDRIKENSTPVAFVVGLLIALLLFRRRR